LNEDPCQALSVCKFGLGYNNPGSSEEFVGGSGLSRD
jgi:hypothetical protein